MLPALDRTWRAVFRPWEAGEAAFAPWEASARWSAGGGFDGAAAAACAALSLLAYQPDVELRRRVLDRAALAERALVAVEATRALVVEGAPGVVVAFRGTMEPPNWRTNLDARPRSWGAHGGVHSGFCAALEALWPALSAALDGRAVARRALVLTGHSLGGALATLAAARVEAAVVYTFGAPRAGTASFLRTVARTVHHRLVHGADVVPSLPPTWAGFRHGGTLRFLDADGALHASPRRTRVYGARLAAALDLRGILDLGETAPAALADHAPAAYLTRLAALGGARPRASR